MAGPVPDAGGIDIAPIQPPEYLFRRLAELDVQMIDERQLARRGQLRIECKLGVDRPAADQRPAGIVADAADDRRADAGGTDDRMRFASIGPQQLFKLKQRTTWMADDLPPVVENMQAVEPKCRNDDDIAVVTAARCGALGQACVGRLQDDDAVRCNDQLEDLPHFEQGTGKDDHGSLSLSRAKAFSETLRLAWLRQAVAFPDNDLDRRNEGMLAHRCSHTLPSCSRQRFQS